MTSDERELAVINPNHVCADKGDSITSPNVLRVQILAPQVSFVYFPYFHPKKTLTVI